MDDKRELLLHFLAALAYRTQKALRDAPPNFAFFHAAEGMRTPARIVCHAPEDFSMANINPERLGPDQAAPVSPDAIWPEAPSGWKPAVP